MSRAQASENVTWLGSSGAIPPVWERISEFRERGGAAAAGSLPQVEPLSEGALEGALDGGPLVHDLPVGEAQHGVAA